MRINRQNIFAGLGLRRFFKDLDGTVAIEGAVAIAAILLLLPMIDFGQYIGVRTEMKQALRAGGQYALQDYTDTSGIQTAVQNATNLKSMTVTVGTLACECLDGTAAVCVGESGYAVCTGNVAPGAYLPVSASVTFDPLIANLPWFSANMTVQEELVMRVN